MVFWGRWFMWQHSIKKEMGDSQLKVVATGGYAELFRGIAGLFDEIDPGLTLKGLEIALNIEG